MSVSRLLFLLIQLEGEKKKISGPTHLITFFLYPFSPEIHSLWLRLQNWIEARRGRRRLDLRVRGGGEFLRECGM